jgi:uncharacterized protein YkwD
MVIVAVTAAVVMPLFAAPASSGQDNAHRALSPLEAGMLAEIDQVREAHGLAPLQVDNALTNAAAAHCSQMVSTGFFSHRTAAGLGFTQRLEYYYPVGRASFYAVAENLYWSSAAPTSSVVISSWMQSPEHRRNILDPSWRQIGLASASVPSAPGVFRELPVTVVTADFGVR